MNIATLESFVERENKFSSMFGHKPLELTQCRRIVSVLQKRLMRL
jgi:hypothetical protein